MPRFFFHIHDNGEVIKDEEGGEFEDLEAAESEARSSARDLVMDFMKRGSDVGTQHIEIMDEAGESLFMMPVFKVVAK